MQPVPVPESKYRAPTNAFTNIVKTNIYKKKEYTHTENDFPELIVPSTTPSTNVSGVQSLTVAEDAGERRSLNYKTASTTVINIVETVKLTPGWAYLSYNYGDENKRTSGDVSRRNCFKCEYEPVKIPREKTFNEEANIVFDKMVDTWEKYKTEFIEVHGLEYYESLYKMPNYQYSNVDNDESDIDDCENDDYDEYDDYYSRITTSKKFDSV